MNTTAAEPTLAPPGAGLPALELIIARQLFRLKCFLGSREKHAATFQRERATIRALTDSCDPTQRGVRVLIPRLPGIEDSSRHWSVWMTLDHLRITNVAFTQVIKSLSKGIVPPRKASTAAVKPDPAVTVEVEAAYDASCDALLAAVAGVADLKTKARYTHPWFGDLDASGWHAVAAMHMGLHRRQIERIMAGLPHSR